MKKVPPPSNLTCRCVSIPARRVRLTSASPEFILPPSSPLSGEEISKIWYSRAEMKAFRRSASEDAKLFLQKKSKLEKLQCSTDKVQEDQERFFRGVEHNTLERAKRTFISIRAVLCMQNSIQNPKIVNPQEPTLLLAKIYSKYNRQAREVALLTGRADYLEALKVYTSTLAQAAESYKHCGNMGGYVLKRKLPCHDDVDLRNQNRFGREAGQRHVRRRT